MGEVWEGKRRKGGVGGRLADKAYSWDGRGKAVYWGKEGIQAALRQIASRCYQRMIWGGHNDVIELSGGNILVFVGICQRIWSVWLRATGQLDRTDSSLPKIDEGLQAVGIHEASTHWFEKLSEETEGNKRSGF